MKLVTAFLALLFAPGVAQAACGPDTDPCMVPGGSYHAALPAGTGPFAAVVFLHGYGSSGQGVLRNSGLVTALLARGYAVIAPDGQLMADRGGRRWDFHPDRPMNRNEADFIVAVADDAAARFDLERDALLLAGFSVGGTMVSYLACENPQAFAAYAPVAGSFWQPIPVMCDDKVQLLHTHGWSDRVVPLEGRAIAADFVQGDVFASLQTWRSANRCTDAQPDDFATSAEFIQRSWTSCAPGSRLDLVVHTGGHMIPDWWATLALNWFEALP